MKTITVMLLCFVITTTIFSNNNTVIFGRVSDNTGKPLHGAIIAIDNLRLLTATAPDGTFSMKVPREDEVTITVSMTGFLSDTLAELELPKKGRFELNIMLERDIPTVNLCDTCDNIVLLGTVKDYLEDEPLEDVFILSPDGTILGQTNENGEYSITTERAKQELTFKHERYLDHNYVISPSDKHVYYYHAELQGKTLEFASGIFRGKVFDKNGKPLRGVSVSLVNTDFSTLTDSSGFYEMGFIPDGQYSVIYTKLNYELALINGIKIVKEIPQSEFIVLNKKKNSGLISSGVGKITGIVKNSNEQEIESAEVFLHKGNKTVYTGLDGRFEIDSIKPGIYDISIHKQGYDTTTKVDVDVWENDVVQLTLVLTKGLKNILKPEPGRALYTGIVIDEKNSKPIIGATITFTGEITYHSVSNVRGEWHIANLRPGTYTITCSVSGFADNTKTNAVVVENTGYSQDFIMAKSSVKRLQKMSVRSVAVKNSSAALLKERQSSISFDDAVTSEEFAQSGASNAADAVKQITGTTIVGGKYVYIRGLGHRYVATQMNGTVVPSPDPDTKAVPMDLFPSSLIDNIVAQKTYSADKPGSFGGGVINIRTKKYPESFQFSTSLKLGYDAGLTFTNNFLTYEGGKLDWLGFDDGTRELPKILKNVKSYEIPSDSEAKKNPILAAALDKVSKSFNPQFHHTNEKALPNISFGFNMGDKFDYWENNVLGYLVSLSYKNDKSFYDDGVVGRYALTGHVDSVENLTTSYKYNEVKSEHTVLWGGLGSLSWELFKDHTVNANYMYTRSASDKARVLEGFRENLLNPEISAFHTKTLHYSQRSINLFQLLGKNQFHFWTEPSLDWKFSLSKTVQNEPDLRYFSMDYTIVDSIDTNGDGITDSLDYSYSIDQSMYPLPSRFFRDLTEKSFSLGSDFHLPIDLGWTDEVAKASVGAVYDKKDRAFKYRQFIFSNSNSGLLDSLDGNIDEFFNTKHTGIIGTTTVVDPVTKKTYTYFDFGNVISEVGTARSNYSGYQKVFGSYIKADVPISSKLKVSAGLRYEYTDMYIANDSIVDSTSYGGFSEHNFLPGASVVYSPKENMKIRGAFGKTMALPSIREFAPFASIDAPGSGFKNGNPNLKPTSIYNYDLRWEYFPAPSEIIAASIFYKKFKNPIEEIIVGSNGDITWENVPEGIVMGLEFEMKKTLWDMFKAGVNTSFIYSRVDLTDERLTAKKQQDNDPETSRPLQGQSPYIINLFLTYFNKNINTDISFYYNVFGPRLSGVSLSAAPDAYEQPFHSLNMSIQQRFKKFTFKVSASNLLDLPSKKTVKFKDVEYDFNSQKKGRSYSLSVKYNVKRNNE